MKLLIVLSIVVVVANAASLEEQWQRFKLNHGKTYKSLREEKLRFEIFKQSVHEIELHNEKFARGEESYSKGINQFTDMTQEEFQQTLSHVTPSMYGKGYEMFNATGIVGDEFVNWVNKGVVTSVKNQLTCGSCWAFSAVGSIEGQVAIGGGDLVSLSPQMLVDCSHTVNDGCNGGLMDDAFIDIEKMGIATEEEYPYKGYERRCKTPKHVQKISGYKLVEQNEDAILKALTTVGPLSISMNATYLYPYSGGIFNHCNDSVDHGVLLVGAGAENGQDYWLIKNSWGANWGENGYFRIPRGEHACGILTLITYPTI